MKALRKPVLSFDEEASSLPFGPVPSRTRRKLLTFEVVREIGAVSGEVWLIQKFDYGLLLRYTVNQHKIRIVLPAAKSQMAEIQPEANSRLHVAETLDGLHDFLTVFGDPQP